LTTATSDTQSTCNEPDAGPIRVKEIVHVYDEGIGGVASDPGPISGVNACIVRVTAVRPKVSSWAIAEVKQRCRIGRIELPLGERTPLRGHYHHRDDEGYKRHKINLQPKNISAIQVN